MLKLCCTLCILSWHYITVNNSACLMLYCWRMVWMSKWDMTSLVISFFIFATCMWGTHTPIKCYVDVFCRIYFVCPSDGDVKSEVPCSVSNIPLHVNDPFSSSSLFGAVFVKSRHQYEAATSANLLYTGFWRFIFLFQWQFKLFYMVIRWLKLLIVVVNVCYSCSVIGFKAFRLC